MKNLEHVAIICDGNGRWAKKRLMPVSFGHNKGMDRIDETIRTAKELEIKFLTFYAFSTENWKRDKKEVDHLLNLIKKFYKLKRQEFIDNDIRFNFIGSRKNVPQDILDIFDKFMNETSHCNSLVVNIAFNYGSHLEIVEAVNDIINEGIKEVDADIIKNHLYTKDQPPVDLLIRTSGEQRLSNFLLWQVAYAEFVFVECLWPDFSREEFLKVIEIYQNRDRRFGGR